MIAHTPRVIETSFNNFLCRRLPIWGGGGGGERTKNIFVLKVRVPKSGTGLERYLNSKIEGL